MLRNYSQDTLDLFESAVKGDRKAFKALMTTEKHPELAAFSNAIRGDESAEAWLRARGGRDLWLICRALDDDEFAFKQLQDKEDKFCLSFMLACQNRIEGKYWLTQNDCSRFLPICETIKSTMNSKLWEELLYRPM
jgi:hypothetical protein